MSVSKQKVAESSHQSKLEHYCRLCGNYKEGREIKYDKFKFHQDIQRYMGLDVYEDVPSIHPAKFCNTCKCKLNRAKSLYYRNKTIKEQKNLPDFKPHSSPCKICGLKRRRSPPKETGRPSVIPAPWPYPFESERQPNDEPMPSSSDGGPHSASTTTLKVCDDEPMPSTSHSASKVVEQSEVESTFANVDIHSIPVERFLDKTQANVFICTICANGVADRPRETTCGHIFCFNCISTWLDERNTCPTCRSEMSGDHLSSLGRNLLALYNSLKVKCIYHENGCQQTVALCDLEKHEEGCKLQKRYRGKGKAKKPLAECTYHYIQQKRLPDLTCSVDTFCEDHVENKKDVLFSMLHNHLRETKDERSSSLYHLWTAGPFVLMTDDECLSLKASNCQSLAEYRRIYSTLKSHGNTTLCPPNRLVAREKAHLPGSVSYVVLNTDGSKLFEHDSNLDSSFINIKNSLNPHITLCPAPNLEGVRFSYIDAICKTLEDIHPFVQDKLQARNINPYDDTLRFKATFKDGGDGMGDVSVHKRRDVKGVILPDKAYRYSFALMFIDVDINGESIRVFQESQPNSTRCNRPLCECIADENHVSSLHFICRPIEEERKLLKSSMLCINFLDDSKATYNVNILNTMNDEKRSRGDSGLKSAGSNYLCDLCYADVHSARDNMGSFSVCRNIEDTCRIASELEYCPSHVLDSRGVGKMPIFKSVDYSERYMDATHADINLSQFFMKLIVHEIAGVHQWEEKQDVLSVIKQAQSKFDRIFVQAVGRAPQLMMPGNYARDFFDIKNEKHILCLLSTDTQVKMSAILSKFRQLREVYRATCPLDSCPDKVKNYKSTAVEMGKLLMLHFPYCRITNYLHKFIEHVQELIEKPNGPKTIGGLSGEGNEAGNKLFRHFRKNIASTGNVWDGLRDVLKAHWLYSSKTLQHLEPGALRKQVCGVCGEPGHNRTTCSKQ